MQIGEEIRKYRKAGELTTEEINHIIYEMDNKSKKESYEEVFQWAKDKLEQYPNCEQLIWQIAVVLDAKRMDF